MGIKGIYGEIGSGERVALAKLAMEKFEKTGRPLRMAIDISIWQFQIQSGKGGSNPAIRTLYYRLLRLLSVSVQPLFVFDGPHKPTFKRNKRVGANGGILPNMLTKQLLKLFGFPFHVAPGEAEAECALLQREGIVDAVLSEDVDTLMFGCGWTFRNWSSEGVRGNKSPTHVSAYEAEATKRGKSGLDREGMILVALMSGGDYITEGIPSCGIKVACEAARAGFGKSLCRIPRSDASALEAWRKGLAHEIQTNEKKFFRIKHKALKIPENFPDREVLGYYTHPVVSSSSKIEKLKSELSWDAAIDIAGLREWVAEVFEWKNKAGAKKFIRGLAPALLVHKLRMRSDRRASGYGDLVLTAMQEMDLVRSICGNRVHFSTDGIREFRVVYHPMDIVDIDLDAEYDDSGDYGRDGLAPVLDDDIAEPYISDDAGRSASPSKRGPSLYDPTQPDKIWIPASIVKVGIPLKAEDYEESLRQPLKKPTKAKAAPKRAVTKKAGMPKGAMEKFVKVTKPASQEFEECSHDVLDENLSTQSDLPPVFLAPSLKPLPLCKESSSKASSTSTRSRSTRTKETVPTSSIEAPRRGTRTRSKASGNLKAVEKTKPSGNPWTFSQSSPLQGTAPSITKPSVQLAGADKTDNYELDSSLLASPPPLAQAPNSPRKHSRSPDRAAESYSEHEPPSSPPSVRFNEQRLPTPPSNEQRIDQPSPRKKKTPPKTTTNAHGSLRHNDDVPPLRVNRMLNFTTESVARERSSSPDDLPTLDQLFTPRKDQSYRKGEVITLSSSPVATEQPPPRLSREVGTAVDQPISRRKKEKPAHGNKYIMLRDSLPGAWKEVDEEEVVFETTRGRSWRLSSVEALDLTED